MKTTITYFKDEPAWETLQEIVGGYVTMVPTHDGRTMYVNEDGLMRELPPNTKAFEMTGRLIVGNVAVVGGSDESSD